MVVVDASVIRTVGLDICCWLPAGNASCCNVKFGSPGSAAEVAETPSAICVEVVVPAGLKLALHVTSQSPAVKLTLVAFSGVVVVIGVVLVVLVRISPTLPAFALLFVVVPTIPFVWLGVNVPVLLNVVNAPVPATVLPIEGGDANNAVKPAPLTAPLAESVVNAPVLAAVAPTVTPFSAPLVA